MYLGLEISRQDAAAVLAAPDGTIRLALRQNFPPNASAGTQWLAAIELCRNVLGRNVVEPSQVQRTGICLHAPVDKDGIVGRSLLMAGWDGYDLKRGFKEHLNAGEAVPASRVQCEGIIEWRAGSLMGERDWVYIHLGRDIEAVAAIGGQLVSGASGLAMDLGGIIIERGGAIDATGRRGTMASYCGGEAYEGRARSYGLTFTRAHETWDIAASSNFAAQSLVEDWLARFAHGLSNVITLLNPAVICIGGGFGNAVFPKLQEPLALRLRDMCNPKAVADLRIVPASSGTDAAVLGALSLARNPLLQGSS